DPGRALDLGVVFRIDQLLLARDPLDERGLVGGIDRLLPEEAPVAFAGMRRFVEFLHGGLGALLRKPQLVDVLAEAHIGAPAREALARRHVHNGHAAFLPPGWPAAGANPPPRRD